MISEERITEALEQNAQRQDNGKWVFDSSLYPHDEAAARAIVEACLILGVPVSATISSAAWLTLVRRLAALEAHVVVNNEGIKN